MQTVTEFLAGIYPYTAFYAAMVYFQYGPLFDVAAQYLTASLAERTKL